MKVMSWIGIFFGAFILYLLLRGRIPAYWQLVKQNGADVQTSASGTPASTTTAAQDTAAAQQAGGTSLPALTTPSLSDVQNPTATPPTTAPQGLPPLPSSVPE